MDGKVQDSTGNGVPSRIILFPRPKGSTTSASPAVFTYTDSTGQFSIQRISSATYSVLAVPFTSCVPSFASATGAGVLSWIEADTIEVTESTPFVTLTVPAIENAGLTSVSGHVVDAGSAPLAGVRILARASNGTITGYGLTDLTGAYVVHALGSGSVTLLADRFEFSHVQLPVTIPVNTFSIQNVNFILSAAYPTDVTDRSTTPSTSRLMQNYPNPFNPKTVVSCQLSVASRVRLVVYDMLGREVATLLDGEKEAGTYRVEFDGSRLATGIYICRMTAGSFVDCKKMMLVK